MMSILLVVTTSQERRPDLRRMCTWTPKTRRPTSRLNCSAQQLQRPAVPPERIVKCDYCWELENCEMWWLLRKRAPCSLANPASKSHLRGCRCPRWWGRSHREAAPQRRRIITYQIMAFFLLSHLSTQNNKSWLPSLRRISVKTQN